MIEYPVKFLFANSLPKRVLKNYTERYGNTNIFKAI